MENGMGSEAQTTQTTSSSLVTTAKPKLGGQSIQHLLGLLYQQMRQPP